MHQWEPCNVTSVCPLLGVHCHITKGKTQSRHPTAAGLILKNKQIKKKTTIISFLFSSERNSHQVDYFGHFCCVCCVCFNVCLAIIHGTLTRTTESLLCAQMLMHAIAYWSVQTLKENLHWKLTLGRISLATPGNRTCVSSVTVWCSYQLSCNPSPIVTVLLYGVQHEVAVCAMSTSAEQRGITWQVFAALGCTQ